MRLRCRNLVRESPGALREVRALDLREGLRDHERDLLPRGGEHGAEVGAQVEVAGHDGDSARARRGEICAEVRPRSGAGDAGVLATSKEGGAQRKGEES